MRITLAVLALVFLGLAQAFVEPESIRYADKDMLLKQKFLFEIVHRVEDPLSFEQWIQHGKSLIVDKGHYEKFNESMEKFFEAYRLGHLLPRGEFFGIMMPRHAEQAIGLFYYFYYAKDWATFQQNVCWARMHVNEGMFVYALNMAVIHRGDFEGLIMPSIYEIFPQHFFNSRFVLQAEKFNYDVWSRNAMYEKELSDAYVREHEDVHGLQKHLVDWKTWQWWKLMGIEPRWHAVEKHLVRDSIESLVKDPKWVEAMRGVEAFWMPVDYTRDINMLNEESALSYFTEEAEWIAFWYYINLDYSPFLHEKEFGLDKDRGREWWLFVLKCFFNRYNMERWSHGLGPIDDFNRYTTIETGYNPQLISWNGLAFVPRANNWNTKDISHTEGIHYSSRIRDKIMQAMSSRYFHLPNGTKVDATTNHGFYHVANLIQGNVDVSNDDFFKSYFAIIQLMLANQEAGDFYDVSPHVLLNYETMMRDPLFYIGVKSLIMEYVHQYNSEPYKRKELLFDGVTIKDVHVSELMTFFDYTDYDVSNLMNDKMTFVDGQYQWNRALFARQTRLNHKPFYFNLTIESTSAQRIVVRPFFGPKFDHEGSVLTLQQIRENFMQFDEFVADLEAGTNVIHRHTNSHFNIVRDRITYTELYRLVLLALEDKYDFPLHLRGPHCAMPERILLPKGWTSGMPMQMFFAVSPYNDPHDPYENFDESVSGGIGSGTRFVSYPFGYPLDREIDESEFFVPNFYFKDVKIYHKDVLEKYHEGYENYGHFDYAYETY